MPPTLDRGSEGGAARVERVAGDVSSGLGLTGSAAAQESFDLAGGVEVR